MEANNSSPVPSRTMSCSRATSEFIGTLRLYDTDDSGSISNSELQEATLDFGAGEISEEQLVAVNTAYQKGCQFQAEPPEPPGSPIGSVSAFTVRSGPFEPGQVAEVITALGFSNSGDGGGLVRAELARLDQSGGVIETLCESDQVLEPGQEFGIDYDTGTCRFPGHPGSVRIRMPDQPGEAVRLGARAYADGESPPEFPSVAAVRTAPRGDGVPDLPDLPDVSDITEEKRLVALGAAGVVGGAGLFLE